MSELCSTIDNFNYVLADKMLKDNIGVSQTDESASMDQPLLFAQPFEHRASKWGAGYSRCDSKSL